MFFSEHKIILTHNYIVIQKELFLFNFDENIYARAAAAAFDAAFCIAADAAFDAACACACAFCMAAAAAFDAALACACAFCMAADADFAAAFDALILFAIEAIDLLPPRLVRCLRDPLLLRRDAILYILFTKKNF
jgi:hypothetical protein